MSATALSRVSAYIRVAKLYLGPKTLIVDQIYPGAKAYVLLDLQEVEEILRISNLLEENEQLFFTLLSVQQTANGKISPLLAAVNFLLSAASMVSRKQDTTDQINQLSTMRKTMCTGFVTPATIDGIVLTMNTMSGALLIDHTMLVRSLL
jgi:hypothetical protein